MTKSRYNKVVQRVAGICIAALLAGCGGPNIWDSAASGKLDDVKALIEAHPDLVNARNKNEKTPLFFAISMNRPEIFEYLIEHGADIHAADNSGLTPLHISAFTRPYKDSSALAKRLVELGADIEAKDKFGDTPLHVAAYKNAPDFVDLLIGLGADPKATNAAGLTPYDVAVKYEQPKSAERLKALTEPAG